MSLHGQGLVRVKSAEVDVCASGKQRLMHFCDSCSRQIEVRGNVQETPAVEKCTQCDVIEQTARACGCAPVSIQSGLSAFRVRLAGSLRAAVLLLKYT